MSDEVITPATNEAPVPGEVKVWWKSATLWTNVVTVGALVLTQYFGVQIDPKLQAGIIAIINLVLQAPRMALTQAKASARNKAIRARLIK